MSGPTVDILMATHNGGAYVDQQVLSIRDQTYADWRLLVSDDLSDDGTPEVIRCWESRDPRISLVSLGVRHGGAKENFFALLRHASSPYVAFCDQDDVWLNDKLELAIGEMRRLERAHGTDKPLLVFTDMVVVNEALDVIDWSFDHYEGHDPRRISFAQLLAQSVGAGCTMMINATLADLLRRTGNLEPVIMHDWWACLIASSLGAIGHVDRPTVLYRQHQDNSIGAKRYGLSSGMPGVGDMCGRVALTLRQASAFMEAYGSMLPAAERATLEGYVSIMDAGPLARVDRLFRYHTWKGGVARKLGQLVAVLAMGQP